jgi:hypothetical protein
MMPAMLRNPSIVLILVCSSVWASGADRNGSAPRIVEPTSIAQQRQSLMKQVQSVERQLKRKVSQGRIGPDFITPLFEPFRADCAPMRGREVEGLIAEAADRESLNPDLIRAVIRRESGFKSCAVSPKGAMGLMQLMPETAQELRVYNTFDPKQNVQAGAAFLKQLLERYHGNLGLALGAYNAGPARVSESGGIPNIEETQKYVQKILAELGVNLKQPSAEERKATIEHMQDPSDTLKLGIFMSDDALETNEFPGVPSAPSIDLTSTTFTQN